MTQRYNHQHWRFFDVDTTIRSLLSIIEGNTNELQNAFSWVNTNEGHTFWSKIWREQEPLTQEVIDILDEMLLELGYERVEYDTEI